MFLAEKPRPWWSGQLADTGVLSNFDLDREGTRVVALVPAPSTQGRQSPNHATVVLNFSDEVRRRVGLTTVQRQALKPSRLSLLGLPHETLANLSITGHLRRFSNQPVAEIVQCGEPNSLREIGLSRSSLWKRGSSLRSAPAYLRSHPPSRLRQRDVRPKRRGQHSLANLITRPPRSSWWTIRAAGLPARQCSHTKLHFDNEDDGHPRTQEPLE